MKTTIDNNCRVFQIIDSFGRSIFCNINDIPYIIDNLNDTFKIYHFWNSKPKKVSKSYLIEVLQSNNVEFSKSITYNMQ